MANALRPVARHFFVWDVSKGRVGHIVLASDATRLKIEGLTLRHAGSWTVRLNRCDDVALTSLTIRNPTSMVYRGMPGIAIENVDGGCVREVLVRDVEIRGHAQRVVHSRGAPQTVRGPRAAGADCAGEGRARVVRERSRAWDTDRLSIRGRPGGRIEDVVLSNVWIEVEGGRGVQVSPLHLPLRIGDDPESLMWGELPAWGVYLRYVRGIRFFWTVRCALQPPMAVPQSWSGRMRTQNSVDWERTGGPRRLFKCLAP